jgi:membrane fusion protein, heavy metal efflux system
MKLPLTYFLVLSLILFSCNGDRNEEPDEAVGDPPADIVKLTATQVEAAQIVLGEVKREPMGKRIQVNGVIEVPPQNMIVIAPQLGGFIRNIELKEGMRVRKGELLLTLDNIEYIQLQQDYLENYSRLQFLQAEYERQQELARENINALKSLQQAKSQYEVVHSSVKGLEAKLRMLNISKDKLLRGEISPEVKIYSPSDGFVSSVNVSRGQYFAAAETLLRIVDLHHVHVLLNVYERDIASVAVGQRVMFTLANSPIKHEAVVYLIGKEITPEKTVSVHCHISDDKINLIPGMYVTASVELTSGEVTVLPPDAIVTFQDKQFIFTAGSHPGIYTILEVHTGETETSRVEVILPPDFDTRTQVVVRGSRHLLGMLRNNPED